jgi:hypothetical protein
MHNEVEDVRRRGFDILNYLNDYPEFLRPRRFNRRVEFLLNLELKKRNWTMHKRTEILRETGRLNLFGPCNA